MKLNVHIDFLTDTGVEGVLHDVYANMVGKTFSKYTGSRACVY